MDSKREIYLATKEAEDKIARALYVLKKQTVRDLDELIVTRTAVMMEGIETPIDTTFEVRLTFHK